MRTQFPLFNTPIDLAHHFWENLLKEQDIAIDATCGNGKDSLVLAKLLQEKKGKLCCIDIQEKALLNTKTLLEKEIPDFLPFVSFYNQSHETLPNIPFSNHLKLVVFNLGYLPGGNKSVTTQVSSTLQAVFQSLDKLAPGGLVSITCYPGHAEGKNEQDVLFKELSFLDPSLWSFTSFFWPNRNASPSLFLVQKTFIFVENKSENRLTKEHV